MDTKNTEQIDELARLKKVSDVDNFICCNFEDLIVTTASESHIKEISELWANLASIQQLCAQERYSFKFEEKDWQLFVRKKLNKKNNLLLVTYEKGKTEIKGFLYLQTITLPSSDLILKGIIEDIYTKPQYRKQGIAAKLLDVALRWAFSQNIKHVDLVSLSKAKDLSAFYQKVLNNKNRNVNLELVNF